MFKQRLNVHQYGHTHDNYAFKEQEDEDHDHHHHHHHHHGGDHPDLGKIKKKILTRRQINKALMDMEDTSPLRDMVGIQHISPLLGYIPFFNQKNIGFRQKLRVCLCKELDVEIPASEQGLIEKPFLMAGYGVNAYFQILGYLCRMFIFITVCCLPLYIIYGQGVGLKGWKSFPLMRFTLGNLGGASTICKQQAFSRGQIKLLCPPNSVIDANNAAFGVISN